MVDILAIGSGAVNAYRQALSTTSNNIANVIPRVIHAVLSRSERLPGKLFSAWQGAQTEAVARTTTSFSSTRCETPK